MLRDNAESSSITPTVKRRSTNTSANVIVKEYGNENLKRFVINPDTTKQLIGTPITKVKLHKVEMEVFKLAFSELSSTTTSTVLVDVFKRGETEDFFQIVKNPKNQGPEIHTICLWKKSENIIVIIDPSNSDFTAYLKTALKNFNDEICIEVHVHNPKSKENHKFYFPGLIRPIGREQNESRDCIDIAAKIATILNETQDINSINFLSNQSAINRSLGGANDTSVRELQSSDAQVRKTTITKFEENKEITEFIIVNTLKELEDLDKLKNNSDFIDQLERNKATIKQLTGKIPLSKLKDLDELQKKSEALSQTFPEFKSFPNLKIKLDKVEKEDIENFYNENGYTELHLAVQNDSYGTVVQVLEKYKKHKLYSKFISAIENAGQTALHWAVGKGNKEIVKLLIDVMSSTDISMKAVGNNDYTALHLAVHSNSIDLVQLLVNKNIPGFVGTADVYGQTALYWAAAKENKDIALILIPVMSDTEMTIKRISEQNTALHVAVHCNSIDIVQLLVNKNVPGFIGMPDKYGQTALHWAASKGLEEIAELLINAMDPVDIAVKAEGNNNYTALHLAVHGDSSKIVQMLLDRKIPGLVGAIDKYGQTALHWAASKGDKKIVELLINAMDPIDIVVKAAGNNNYTALHLAVYRGSNNIVQMLLDKKIHEFSNIINEQVKSITTVKSMSFENLSTLDLADLNISDEYAFALSEPLKKNDSIETLNLEFNLISQQETIKALSFAWQGQELERKKRADSLGSLNVSCNYVIDDERKTFKNFLIQYKFIKSSIYYLGKSSKINKSEKITSNSWIISLAYKLNNAVIFVEGMDENGQLFLEMIFLNESGKLHVSNWPDEDVKYGIKNYNHIYYVRPKNEIENFRTNIKKNELQNEFIKEKNGRLRWAIDKIKIIGINLDMSILSKETKTPSEIDTSNDLEDELKKLAALGLNDLEDELRKSAALGLKDNIESILKNNPNIVEAKSPELKRTALHYTFLNNRTNLKELLFRYKTPVKNVEGWEKWKGRVIGSDEEIKEAIGELKRDPESFKEVEDIIFKNRTEKLNKMLKESIDSGW